MASSEMRLFDVIDRASRWKSSVRAIEEPAVVTHAGYVHVRVDVGARRPVDCFVYDAPLVTGQALTRLLNAAEIGIRYQNIELREIDTMARSPFLLIDAKFLDEDTQAPGRLFVGIVPKVQLPLVCSQESTSPDTLRATLSRLAESMVPSSDFSVDTLGKGEERLVFELWALYDGARPVGFRQWRAAQDASGHVTVLEIASILASRGARLSTTDVRVSERTDGRGLLIADWLELVDGDMHARAALERLPGKEDAETQASFTYRIASAGAGATPSESIFSEEPLRSAYDEYLSLSEAAAGDAPTELHRFLPHVNVTEPTKVSWPPTEEASVQLQVGDRTYDFVVDEGAVLERRESGSSRRAKLLLRLLGPG